MYVKYTVYMYMCNQVTGLKSYRHFRHYTATKKQTNIINKYI